jgi:hypothetical protein
MWIDEESNLIHFDTETGLPRILYSRRLGPNSIHIYLEQKSALSITVVVAKHTNRTGRLSPIPEWIGRYYHNWEKYPIVAAAKIFDC